MDNKLKLDSFRKLRNPAHALEDLALLKNKNPTLDRLVRYSRNPLRYADDILYDLLDCCSADKVVSNRYPEKKAAAKTKAKKNAKATKNTKAAKPKPSKPKASEAKETKPKDTAEKTVTEKQQEEVSTAAAEAAPESKETEEAKKK